MSPSRDRQAHDTRKDGRYGTCDTSGGCRRGHGRVIHEILDMEGYRVVRAVDGESLDVARSEQPHLILHDISMPGINGPDVSRRLRAEPATAPIPIVVMSSHVARRRPEEMSHDDRLPKPVALDNLYAMVARWLLPAPSRRRKIPRHPHGAQRRRASPSGVLFPARLVPVRRAMIGGSPFV